MTIKLTMPETITELKPRITVIGVGGAGGNAVNNMIKSNLEGVEFVATNTDAQALSQSLSERIIQLGASITQGLGAGSRPTSAAPRPKRTSTTSWSTSTAATWCSSPPGWAAAPGPAAAP